MFLTTIHDDCYYDICSAFIVAKGNLEDLQVLRRNINFYDDDVPIEEPIESPAGETLVFKYTYDRKEEITVPIDVFSVPSDDLLRLPLVTDERERDCECERFGDGDDFPDNARVEYDKDTLIIIETIDEEPDLFRLDDYAVEMINVYNATGIVYDFKLDPPVRDEDIPLIVDEVISSQTDSDTFNDRFMCWLYFFTKWYKTTDGHVKCVKSLARHIWYKLSDEQKTKVCALHNYLEA